MTDTAYTLTAENMLRTLPIALKNDSRMVALATSIAQTLEQRSAEIRRLEIYNLIDELPEELLDIVARDFKVDWYDFDYGIVAKRRIIKSSFYVHRHLGTIGAVKAALDSIYPDSRIEEWFDYDGAPYSFRVILNMSVAFVVPVDTERVLWAINFYKSLRSHADGVYYQSAFRFGIGCKTGYVLYGERLCGTFPERATQGGICAADIAVQTAEVGASYTHPETGVLSVGTFPVIATQGGHAEADIPVATGITGVAYKPTRIAGEYPARATQGVILDNSISVEYLPSGTAYNSPPTGEKSAGTHPGTATSGGSENSGIAAEENGLGVSYSTKVCGSAPGSFFVKEVLSMIDSAGFSDLRNYIKRRIAYGRYRVGSTYYKTDLSSVTVLPNGTVRAQMAITGLGQITVNRVELFNGDQQLWAHEDINIEIKTGQTGILYWFDFTVKEEAS